MYWIDGYNLLFRLTKEYKVMRKKERPILLAINEVATRRNLQLTLVFDGRQKDPPEAIRGNLANLTIIYTSANQSADNYILQEIDGSSDEIVVSSDRELTGKAKQRGCKTQTIEAFIEFLFKKPKKKTSEEKKRTSDTSADIERLRKAFEDKLK